VNPTKADDGRNAVVEEIKVLGPDTREALGRYEELERGISRDVRDFEVAITQARRALGSINVRLQMMREETAGNTAELERRLAAIDSGALRLGYPYLPTFRVVAAIDATDPEEAPA
jgi:hypothetical protein